jgi:hypothetical protein
MSDTKIPSWRSVIQYWAYNMDLIHRGAMEWPGFGYTKDEKEQLSALAAGLSGWKFIAFLFLNALFFIGLAGVVIGVGVMPIAALLDPTHQSGMVFLGCLGVGAVVCLGFGIPATMGLTAVTLNLIASPSEPGPLSDEQAAALYHKMNRQITRMGVTMGVLLVPLVLFGRTQIGGQFLAFTKQLILAVMPFAVVLTVLRAMAPKFKPKQ